MHGRRIPGMPAAQADDFAPFAAYCKQRLADNPHLRTPSLLAEITRLGFPGARRTFYASAFDQAGHREAAVRSGISAMKQQAAGC